jgi:hypothetical protein
MQNNNAISPSIHPTKKKKRRKSQYMRWNKKDDEELKRMIDSKQNPEFIKNYFVNEKCKRPRTVKQKMLGCSSPDLDFNTLLKLFKVVKGESEQNEANEEEEEEEDEEDEEVNENIHETGPPPLNGQNEIGKLVPKEENLPSAIR